VLAVLEVPSKTAHEIFGSPDDLEILQPPDAVRAGVSPDDCFAVALERFYGGRRDEKTMALLDEPPTR